MLQGILNKVVRIMFLLIVVFINTACAQTSDYITYSPDWKIGESASYTIVQKLSRANYFTTSHVNIKVVEKTKAGYVLEWKVGDVETSAEYKKLPIETQALLDAVTKISTDQAIRYRTDKNGVFQEIVNVDEIRSSSNRSLDIIINRIPDGPEKEKMKNVRQKMMQDDSLIKTPSRELASLHNNFICGETFHAEQKYQEKVQIPNMFDANVPLEGTVSIMASHDGTINTYRMVSIFDKKLILKSMVSMFEKLSGTTFSEAKIKAFEEANQGAELTDSYIFTIIDGENWIEGCSFERKMTVKGKTITETFKIIRERGEQQN